MLVFYFFVTGAYVAYCRSKYYPVGLYRLTAPWSSWLALALFGVGALLLVRAEGWGSGLLLAVSALMLALSLIQLSAVFGRRYFYGLLVLVHGLTLLDLLA
jgi:hypothetical protein